MAPQNYRVEGLVLSEDAEPVPAVSRPTPSAIHDDHDPDDSESESEALSSKRQSYVTPPAPRYDVDHDQVLTGAKLVEYIGCGLAADAVESGNYGFELPPATTLIPLNGLAASRALGEQEARIWSARWFARGLLEGRVFEQLSPWFPSSIKKNLKTHLLTVSWGL